jgi:hypothetical protein
MHVGIATRAQWMFPEPPALQGTLLGVEELVVSRLSSSSLNVRAHIFPLLYPHKSKSPGISSPYRAGATPDPACRNQP